MRPFSILILALCSSQLAFAQTAPFREGSIRLKGGQEKPGFIGTIVKNDGEEIQYKVHPDSAIELYKAGEIDGYTLGQNFYSAYLTSRSSEDWFFAEVVVEGELSLIYRNGMTFLRRRNSDEFVHLRAGYRTVLSSMMENCPYLAAKSLSVTMNKESLANHVKAYNECVAIKNPNLDGIPKNVSIGLFIGGDYTQTSFQNVLSGSSTRFLSADKQRDKAFVQAGVDVLFKPHKKSNHIGLYLGAFYNTNQFSATNSELVAQQVEVNTYNIKYNELKIPIGFELSNPWKTRVSMHYRVGIVIPRIIRITSSHSSYETMPISGNNVYYHEPSSLKSFKTTFMYGGAIGADYHLAGTEKIRLQASCNVGNITAVTLTQFDETPIKGKIMSLNLMAGYIF